MKTLNRLCAILLALLLVIGGTSMAALADEPAQDAPEPRIEQPAPAEAPAPSESKPEPKPEPEPDPEPAPEPPTVSSEPVQPVVGTPEPAPAPQDEPKEEPKDEPKGEENKPEKFTIRFIANGEETKRKLEAGERIEKPNTDPSLKGHEFVHWYDADGSEQAEFRFGEGAERDLTLKALFRELPKPDPEQPTEDVVEETEAEVPELPGEEVVDEVVEENVEEPGEQIPEEPGEEIPEEPAQDEAQEDKNRPEPPRSEEPAVEIVHVSVADAEAYPTITETVAPEETEQPGIDLSELSISITHNATGELRYGDTITLFGQLDGFENIDQYQLVWQHDDGNGGWSDAQIGGLSHAFELTDESEHWSWKLTARIQLA